MTRQFFSGSMKQFEKTETRTNLKGRKYTRLKFAEIIDAIGEGKHATSCYQFVFAHCMLVVTQHTPTLEVISGECRL